MDFISAKQFNEMAEKQREESIPIAWRDVPINEIFKIDNIKIVNVDMENNDSMDDGMILSLLNKTGRKLNVWATSRLREDIEQNNYPKEKTLYICSLGRENMKTDGRWYYKYELVCA